MKTIHWKTSLKMAATAMAEGNHSYVISPVFKTNHVEVTVGNTKRITLLVDLDSCTGKLNKLSIITPDGNYHFLEKQCKKVEIKKLMHGLFFETANRYLHGENMEHFKLLYDTLGKNYYTF